MVRPLHLRSISCPEKKKRKREAKFEEPQTLDNCLLSCLDHIYPYLRTPWQNTTTSVTTPTRRKVLTASTTANVVTVFSVPNTFFGSFGVF